MDEKNSKPNWRTIAVPTLLLVQLVLLLASFDGWPIGAISIFCTGPGDSLQGKIFGYLHLGFGILFVLGLAAIFVRKMQLIYIIACCAGLAMLPLQAVLVFDGVLTCDVP